MTNNIAKSLLKLRHAVTAALTAAAFLATALLSPVGAFAVTADPDSLDTPGIFDAADEGVDSLKERIADLEKIIALNVPRAEKVPVLLYHHLAREAEMTAEQKNNESVLSVERFSEQMKYLYDNKYYTASLAELEQYIAGELTLPERTVVITFDDGYRSNTKYAYPILKKYDFKAAIFLITSLIGVRENVIEHASWTDLRKCSDVFMYHSHSHDMHKLQRNGQSYFASSDSDEIQADLLISKALLSTSYFAYPYGQTGRAAKRALGDAGYRMGFTTVAAYTDRKTDVTEIPRFTISPAIDAEAYATLCGGGLAVSGDAATATAPPADTGTAGTAAGTDGAA